GTSAPSHARRRKFAANRPQAKGKIATTPDRPAAPRVLATDCRCAALRAAPYREYANRPSLPLRRAPRGTVPQTGRRSASTDPATPDKSCLPAETKPSARYSHRLRHCPKFRHLHPKPNLGPQSRHRPERDFPPPPPRQSRHPPAYTAWRVYFSTHTRASSPPDCRPTKYPCRGRPCLSTRSLRPCAPPAQ